jgi:hypothetical protein
MEDSIFAGITSGGTIGVIYVIWKLFKHSSCRSRCCGKEASMSVDLEKGFPSKSSPAVVEKPVVQVEAK